MHKMENNDKPAFPNDKQYQLSGDEYEGLTKREYFAAKALQGIMTRAGLYENGDNHCDYYAKQCVEITDAVLKALEKQINKQD